MLISEWGVQRTGVFHRPACSRLLSSCRSLTLVCVCDIVQSPAAGCGGDGRQGDCAHQALVGCAQTRGVEHSSVPARHNAVKLHRLARPHQRRAVLRGQGGAGLPAARHGPHQRPHSRRRLRGLLASSPFISFHFCLLVCDAMRVTGAGDAAGHVRADGRCAGAAVRRVADAPPDQEGPRQDHHHGLLAPPPENPQQEQGSSRLFSSLPSIQYIAHSLMHSPVRFYAWCAVCCCCRRCSCR